MKNYPNFTALGISFAMCIIYTSESDGEGDGDLEMLVAYDDKDNVP